MSECAVVSVVDSDAASREHVCDLVASMKLAAASYASAREFLHGHDLNRAGCAILEVRISDMSGLQLQKQLAERQTALPVIFLAAYASVPVVVRAIQAGAVNFLQKPAEEQELWETIQRAIQIDRERRSAAANAMRLRNRLELLTDRELDVLQRMAQHKTARRIAHELGVSLRTVETRRVRMLKKLQLSTPLQLFHFAIHTFNGCAAGACALAMNAATDDEFHGNGCRLGDL